MLYNYYTKIRGENFFMNTINTILCFLLFIGIPAGIIIFFIVSLIMLKKTPKDSEKHKKIKTGFIISSILMGILITAVTSLFIMISISLTYM